MVIWKYMNKRISYQVFTLKLTGHYLQLLLPNCYYL
jgi:hypothetical protein